MDEKTYVGIDVAKNHLDIAIYESQKVWRINNDTQSIQDLVEEMRSISPRLVVLEATGGHEMKAAKALYLADVPIAIVNPRFTRSFAKSLGHLAKTDRIDAKDLAHYAAVIQPSVTMMPSEEEEELRALVRRRWQLIEARTQDKNRVKSAGKSIDDSLNRHIEWLTEEIERIAKTIDVLIKASNLFRQKVQILKSFNGVGDVLAYGLLSELPEIGKLNRKKIAALAGLAPMNKDSGKKKGERSIAGGRHKARTLLYMPTLSAIRHNPSIRELYNRLLEKGKTKKVAITACMRKVLIILNAMIRNQTTWQADFAK